VALIALEAGGGAGGGDGGRCVAHLGAGRAGVPPGSAGVGPVAARALEARAGTYLASLALYPGGQAEFGGFLPSGTAGVLVAPGAAGRLALVLATDTPRGFGRLDQAWAADLADKVEAGLYGGGGVEED
jgi:hypothetical protein